jgi:hypothetical protein
MIIASVHTLNSVSDDGRRAVSGEVLQRVTAGALEAARSLRFRIAQMAEMAKQDATPAATAAPKQRGKTNASRAGR